jgi:glycosyltransferase involved in cell wall biosynthesis
MNICVLTTTYPRYPGDHQGSFILGQVNALGRAGHHLEVIVPRDPTITESSYTESESNVDVHRFDYWLPARRQSLCYGAGIPENFRRNRLVALQVPALLAAFVSRALPFARGCDIVHGHWTFGGLAALWAGRLARKPVVLTLHGTEVLHPALRPANRYLVKRVDRVIVNSRFTRDTLLRHIPDAQPTIIPFGVNEEKLAPPDFDRAAFRAAAGVEPDAAVLLAVGRLVERKGFHVLIEAAARLSLDHPVLTLIGGSGPEAGALQAQIEAAGLSERVRLLGRVEDDDLAKWYAAADVFVLPAVVDSSGDTEGLGVVMLEAMANDTPVIASRTGGITDIVRHGETGLLVTPGDPADLAEQISLLLSDGEVYARVQRGAREHMAREFSWEAITRRLLDCYQDCLA